MTLRVFIGVNDWTWQPHPTVNEAEHAVLAIAAGEWEHQRVSAWLKAHLSPTSRDRYESRTIPHEDASGRPGVDAQRPPNVPEPLYTTIAKSPDGECGPPLGGRLPSWEDVA